jgi:hypothetical protein
MQAFEQILLKTLPPVFGIQNHSRLLEYDWHVDEVADSWIRILQSAIRNR